MSPRLRIAYFAHSVRSDWNNGNAHFLRGLLRELGARGHEVLILEPTMEWSIKNLLEEAGGEAALAQFREVYPELKIETYNPAALSDSDAWRSRLRGVDLVLVHEWNVPELARTLLDLRREVGYRMIFHDTHHRASSSPEQIRFFGVDRFDGVVVFGEVLRSIYRERFGMTRVWTLHEAADTKVFRPINRAATSPDEVSRLEVVWIGNWGDEERSAEIKEFLLRPAAAMRHRRFTIYGVRYPEAARNELCGAGVHYGGYLPNLEAPRVYAESSITVHVPRQQYAREMIGIPTIRVFEALACGIPLLSAPWRDVEGLFRKEDFVFAHNAEEMRFTMANLLDRPEAAEAQAARGLETVLSRHTCELRAAELEQICLEVLA